jgi:hypothetical protein
VDAPPVRQEFAEDSHAFMTIYGPAEVTCQVLSDLERLRMTIAEMTAFIH